MDALSPYLGYLLSGVWTTLKLLVLAGILTVLTAAGIAAARLSPRWYVRAPATVLVEFFRGTSAIVQLFWVFYVLPFAGISLPPFFTAVLVLGLNEGSYASEIVRSGIKSVSVGQVEATVALNLGRVSRFWRIILPQAIPFMIPPFGNTFINLSKLTSLASLVTVSDLTFRAQGIRANIGQTALIFGIVLGVYFAISMVISLLTVLAERAASARLGGSPPSSGDWRESWGALRKASRALPIRRKPSTQLQGDAV